MLLTSTIDKLPIFIELLHCLLLSNSFGDTTEMHINRIIQRLAATEDQDSMEVNTLTYVRSKPLTWKSFDGECSFLQRQEQTEHRKIGECTGMTSERLGWKDILDLLKSEQAKHRETIMIPL